MGEKCRECVFSDLLQSDRRRTPKSWLLPDYDVPSPTIIRTDDDTNAVISTNTTNDNKNRQTTKQCNNSTATKATQ